MLAWIKKKCIIRYLIACVCVLLLICVIFREEKKALQYDVVIFGDSVVGTVWGEVSVDSVIENRLGMSVFNGAFGGTTMSVRDTKLWESMSSMEWCMVKLTEAICYNDWSSQLTVMRYADSYGDINVQSLDYFAKRMDKLSQIDFSQVKMVIIGHGTNDYNGGKKVDNPENLYDVTTFGGALRYSLKLLQETYPDLRIVVMSPIYCALGENRDLQCYNTSYGEGGVLDEYVELEKQICEEFGVEWIDAYHDSGIWEENVDTYMVDSLHPRVVGQELLANLIVEYLEANVDG